MAALEDAISSIGLDPATLQMFGAEDDQTIYYIQTNGEEALEQWRSLREMVPQSGYWPVILGSMEDLQGLQASFSNKAQMPPSLEPDSTVEPRKPYSAAEVIAQVEQYFQEGSSGEDEADEPEEIDLEELEYIDEEFRGDWPEETAVQTAVYATTDLLQGGFLPEVYMGFVPTTTSWHLPAYFRFSSQDHGMSPIDHCLTLKPWEARYQAEVVALTGAGTIEMVVANPPRTRDGALALAVEQYNYCSDIVGQGTETVDALAAALLNSPFWYFWWD